jgi:hypothetical protein
LQHKSFIGINEEKSHSAGTTVAFLKKLVPTLKESFPGLEHINYVSDSPANQYRNKSIVKLISEHEYIFGGVSCSWDFLETGHGKGPCDGVGGTIKKGADIAIKSGRIISNVDEFYTWAKDFSPKMTCLLVTPQDVRLASRHLTGAKFVKNLSKAHSIRPYKNQLWMRETSCYRPCCQKELMPRVGLY